MSHAYKQPITYIHIGVYLFISKANVDFPGYMSLCGVLVPSYVAGAGSIQPGMGGQVAGVPCFSMLHLELTMYQIGQLAIRLELLTIITYNSKVTVTTYLKCNNHYLVEKNI